MPLQDTCVCDCDDCEVGDCGGGCARCDECNCLCDGGIGTANCMCDCKSCQKDPCCRVNGCCDCSGCSCSCSDKKGKKPMSDRTKKIVGGAKRVVSNAALRTGASQVVKKSKATMVALLSKKIDPKDSGLKKKLAKFLDTQEGEAMLAGILSLFTLPASQFDEDGEPMNAFAKLGAELQISALHKISDEWIDQAMGPLMLIASQMFGKEVATIASNVRVAADAIDGKSDGEEAEVAAKVPGQHKKANG